jgi:small-conductance mechanosensitive channel/CRP-like cAMP-binding protein
MTSDNLFLGIAAFVVILAIRTFTVNRLVKRKLRLSLIFLSCFLAINVFLILRPGIGVQALAQLHAFEKLAMAAALINALVFSLANPLRQDHVPDRFPIILQDAMVIALVIASAMFLSAELVTTSAVSAVVLGFALQDTLGNAFAGLAIQSEKPFNVGHWVKVGEHEGRVAEVTWRATKLRTKSGNFVILPNNVVAKEAVVNYSEPAEPTRLYVEVGASYLVAPNVVKSAIGEALRNCPLVLTAPAPDVVLASFDASAITYRARFWIQDYEADERARDQVRTSIYYVFQRHRIEIPWPISVEYKGELPTIDAEADRREIDAALAGTDLLAPLAAEIRDAIAQSCRYASYTNGEAIVHQGDAGQSMFIVAGGEVSVILEPGRDEVARIGRGGYFGEMSLLTGEPRSATVLAIGETSVIELNADLFRRLGAEYPAAIEQMALGAIARRADLERLKSSTAGVAAVEANTLRARMKKFLRL